MDVNEGCYRAFAANQLMMRSLLERRKDKSSSSNRSNCDTIRRTRKSIQQVYRELGPNMFRRSFRMEYSTFSLLFAKIKPQLVRTMGRNRRKKRKHAVNGLIPLASRLGCAIRYWAGADPYDLMLVFGISYTEVHTSVTYVLDAVNLTKSFDIKFPTEHAEQYKIAEAFKAKSKADFDICVGCVDGMLVWIHLPSKEECERIGVGQAKFICGRKSKCGLNLQAICDAERRFLDISILFGASASDLLAFESSPIRVKMDSPNFVAPGLCLFGDNAYINRLFMATPIPNLGQHTENRVDKDAYNFYHSQLRINIECAFGILVNRFGWLRKQAPVQYTIKKTLATVSCLCKLHNFLIDRRLGVDNTEQETIAEITPQDELNITVEGGVPLEGVGTSQDVVPGQLLGSGEHFDDDPRYALRRRITQMHGDNMLPRACLLNHVMERGLRRPVHNVERNGASRR